MHENVEEAYRLSSVPWIKNSIMSPTWKWGSTCEVTTTVVSISRVFRVSRTSRLNPSLSSSFLEVLQVECRSSVRACMHEDRTGLVVPNTRSLAVQRCRCRSTDAKHPEHVYPDLLSFPEKLQSPIQTASLSHDSADPEKIPCLTLKLLFPCHGDFS